MRHNARQSDNNRVYVLVLKIFWALLRAHFNLWLMARAKMSRSRAQNIFMPANINSMFFSKQRFIWYRKTENSVKKIGLLLFFSILDISWNTFPCVWCITWSTFKSGEEIKCKNLRQECKNKTFGACCACLTCKAWSHACLCHVQGVCYMLSVPHV